MESCGQYQKFTLNLGKKLSVQPLNSARRVCLQSSRKILVFILLQWARMDSNHSACASKPLTGREYGATISLKTHRSECTQLHPKRIPESRKNRDTPIYGGKSGRNRTRTCDFFCVREALHVLLRQKSFPKMSGPYSSGYRFESCGADPIMKKDTFSGVFA